MGVGERAVGAVFEEFADWVEDEAGSAAEVDAGVEVDVGLHEVGGASEGEFEGAGGGFEVRGGDAAAGDVEGSGGATGDAVGDVFAREEGVDDGGERAEEGESEDVTVFEGGGAGAFDGVGGGALHLIVHAAGEVAAGLVRRGEDLAETAVADAFDGDGSGVGGLGHLREFEGGDGFA